MHVPQSMDEVVAYIKASKDVVDLLKSLSGLLPKGASTDQIERRVADAEKALKASEAQLAKALGYQLCQCTFPPQIMLLTGRHPRHDNLIFKCQTCGIQEPSEHSFKIKDRNEDAFEALRKRPSPNYF